MKNKILLTIGVLFVSACSVQTFKPAPSLQENATRHEVKGASVKNMFGENTISYGQYRSAINYGWVTQEKTSISNYSVSQKKQSFSFMHNTPAGDTARVACSSQEKAIGIALKDMFVGNIDENKNGALKCTVTSQADNATWNVIITNPFGKELGVDTKGSATAAKGSAVIEMRQEQSAYIFSHNGQDVAALATEWNSYVWIKNNLEKEPSLLVSAMITAMLAKVDP